MPEHRVRARTPRGEWRLPPIVRDPDVVEPFLHDAAHFPGGRANGVATPATEAEVAALIDAASAVLPIGAQSSLTGGATPIGEVVLSPRRFSRIEEIGREHVCVGAGVTVADLTAVL